MDKQVVCPACGLKFSPPAEDKYIECPKCEAECGRNPNYEDTPKPSGEKISLDDFFKQPPRR